METVKGILKEIKKIFKKGYVPSRGAQEYVFKGERIADRAGNFEHAVLNFTNEQLSQISPVQARGYDDFIAEPRKSGEAWIKTEENFLNYTKSLGLKIEECEENAEINPEYQWKIAYFRKISEFVMHDILFAIQEKNKSWTIKFGDKVLKYGVLPQYIQFTKYDYLMDQHYSKFRTYVITNPIAEKRYKREQIRLKAAERKEQQKSM